MTTVTHKNDEPWFGDTPLISAAQDKTFIAMIFEMFSGKMPTKYEGELFELLLKLSIDHGTNTPSAKTTIMRAGEKRAMGDAVGAGIAEINNAHGGATGPAMSMFYETKESGNCGRNVVANFEIHKERVPGFGHRIYKKDPRAELILETIVRLGFPDTYIDLARELEKELAESLPHKILPLNIDGAIAVALCTLRWRPEWSTAVFISSRSAGLCAHYLNTAR